MVEQDPGAPDTGHQTGTGLIKRVELVSGSERLEVGWILPPEAAGIESIS